MESSGDVRPARHSAQTHLRFGAPDPRILGPTLAVKAPDACRPILLFASSENEIGNDVTRGVLITPAHVTRIYI